MKTYSPDAWAQLGKLFRRARGTRSRREICAATGLVYGTVQSYEGGKVFACGIPARMLILAEYYGWAPDAVDQILAGNVALPAQRSAASTPRSTAAPSKSSAAPSASWVEPFVAWAEGDVDVIYLVGTDVPQRVRDLLASAGTVRLG